MLTEDRFAYRERVCLTDTVHDNHGSTETKKGILYMLAILKQFELDLQRHRPTSVDLRSWG